MKKKISPQSDYYSKTSLNTTQVSLSTKEEWENHRNKRCNLYIKKLNLPQIIWKNSQVLEIGPSSGENALVWAHESAKFTFIEPCEHLSKQLLANFKTFKLENQIVHLYKKNLEEFNIDKTFDIIIAEGFLYCLENRNEELQKIMSLVSPGGLLIFSTLDPFGNFLEHLKIVYCREISKRNNCTSNSDIMDIAKKIFHEDFKKLSHSRSFEAFAYDTFLSPYHGTSDYWGFEEISNNFENNDFFFYSSWPNYIESDDLTWHKVVLTKSFDDLRIDYRRRIPNFLFGGKGNAMMDLEWTEKRGKRFGELLLKLQSFFVKKINTPDNSDTNCIEELKELKKLTHILWKKDDIKRKTFQEIEELYNALLDNNKKYNGEEMIEIYESSQHIRNTWGMPYHYLVWHKKWS